MATIIDLSRNFITGAIWRRFTLTISLTRHNLYRCYDGVSYIFRSQNGVLSPKSVYVLGGGKYQA